MRMTRYAIEKAVKARVGRMAAQANHVCPSCGMSAGSSAMQGGRCPCCGMAMKAAPTSRSWWHPPAAPSGSTFGKDNIPRAPAYVRNSPFGEPLPDYERIGQPRQVPDFSAYREPDPEGFWRPPGGRTAIYPIGGGSPTFGPWPVPGRSREHPWDQTSPPPRSPVSLPRTPPPAGGLPPYRGLGPMKAAPGSRVQRMGDYNPGAPVPGNTSPFGNPGFRNRHREPWSNAPGSGSGIPFPPGRGGSPFNYPAYWATIPPPRRWVDWGDLPRNPPPRRWGLWE